MKPFVPWIDCIDSETADKSGVFNLYRNYCTENTRGEYIYEYAKISGTLKWDPLLTEKTPIAKGVTAYFYISNNFEDSIFKHLSEKTSFSTQLIYENYFLKLFNAFFINYNSRPVPISWEEVMRIFLPKHLEDENIFIQESDNYYLDCLDETDRNIKAQIKEYVAGYLSWVNSQIVNTLVEQPNSSYIIENQTHQHIQSSLTHQLSNSKTMLTHDDLSDSNKEILNRLLSPLQPDDSTKKITDLSFKIYLTNLFLSYIDTSEYKKVLTNEKFIIYEIQPFYKIITKVLIEFCIDPNSIKNDISDVLKKAISAKTVGNNLPSFKCVKIAHRENQAKNRENRENREN
jgi:hypothetical protein